MDKVRCWLCCRAQRFGIFIP